MARARRARKQLPRGVLEARKRLQRALLETFERLWKERPREEGNTQASTMERAGLSVQQWGNWARGDDDMTLTSAVAVAVALDRRIDFALPSLSDPSDTVRVVTNEEGEPLSDDVLRLAAEIDKLPDAVKARIVGNIEGMLTMARVQPGPSALAGDKKRHPAS